MLMEKEVLIAEGQSKQNFRSKLMDFQSEAGKGAVKTALVINGGAVIALLAFAGSILSNGGGNAAIEHLADGFICFSHGVLIAAASALTRYMNATLQLRYVNEAMTNNSDLSKMEVTFLGYIVIKAMVILRLYFQTTILLVVVSFILFYCGVTNTVEAFSA